MGRLARDSPESTEIAISELPETLRFDNGGIFIHWNIGEFKDLKRTAKPCNRQRKLTASFCRKVCEMSFKRAHAHNLQSVLFPRHSMRSTISSVVAAFIRPPPYSGSTKVCIPEAFQAFQPPSALTLLCFISPPNPPPKPTDRHLVHMATFPYFICIHICMFFSRIFNRLALQRPYFQRNAANLQGQVAYFANASRSFGRNISEEVRDHALWKVICLAGATSSRSPDCQVTSFRISIEFWHNEHNFKKISKQLYTVSTEITVPKIHRDHIHHPVISTAIRGFHWSSNSLTLDVSNPWWLVKLIHPSKTITWVAGSKSAVLTRKHIDSFMVDFPQPVMLVSFYSRGPPLRERFFDTSEHQSPRGVSAKRGTHLQDCLVFSPTFRSMNYMNFTNPTKKKVAILEDPEFSLT